MSPSKEVLLIVEDEESISEGLKFNFEREGFEVVLAGDGRVALDVLASRPADIDLIILDLMLPEIDGFEVLQQTRTWAAGLPILVLSARSQESDRIRVLELGADDFLAKPFSLKELLLRVKGLLKRSSWIKERYSLVINGPTVAFGNGIFAHSSLTFEIKDSHQAVRLSPTEAALLLAFAAAPNVIQTRQQLLRQVWHYEPGTETRTVDVFVSKLRKVIELNEKKPKFLLSVRGAGYAYVTDERMREALGSTL
jgi:DNA-binding response OmpR family regulator